MELYPAYGSSMELGTARQELIDYSEESTFVSGRIVDRSAKYASWEPYPKYNRYSDFPKILRAASPRLVYEIVHFLHADDQFLEQIGHSFGEQVDQSFVEPYVDVVSSLSTWWLKFEGDMAACSFEFVYENVHHEVTVFTEWMMSFDFRSMRIAAELYPSEFGPELVVPENDRLHFAKNFAERELFQEPVPRHKKELKFLEQYDQFPILDRLAIFNLASQIAGDE